MTMLTKPRGSTTDVKARPLCIGIAFPGGFEFGGIGRMMLYATEAFAATAAGPCCTPLDARGTGHIAMMPIHLLRTVGWLAWAQLNGQVDLVHLNVAGRGSTLRKIMLSETAAFLRLPTIVHLHDYDYQADIGRRGIVGRHFVRRLFRRAERVVVLGLRDEVIATELLGVEPARLMRLPNAVPDPGQPPLRQKRGRPVRLVFLGNLDDRKGVPELLQALASPVLRGLPWTIDFAGGGATGRFATQANELGISARTSFHGWLDAAGVRTLCRDADIFVLPSHAEGQAMALLEAMAHGLAIVTTPVGAHLEAVTPDQEALLVAPGDVAGLADALETLVTRPDLRARLGGAARQRYLKAFAITSYAEKLAALYQAALRDSERVSPRQAPVISELKG
jgi:glycosyltransferase involved in cell wall biosynthesis